MPKVTSKNTRTIQARHEGLGFRALCPPVLRFVSGFGVRGLRKHEQFGWSAPHMHMGVYLRDDDFYIVRVYTARHMPRDRGIDRDCI